MDADGTRLVCERTANKPIALLEAASEFPPGPEVVIEATYGSERRVKNDERDPRDLADLLRPGRLTAVVTLQRALEYCRGPAQHHAADPSD
jgi:hypothetical protein